MAYFQGKVAFRQLIFGGYLVAITRILGYNTHRWMLIVYLELFTLKAYTLLENILQLSESSHITDFSNLQQQPSSNSPDTHYILFFLYLKFDFVYAYLIPPNIIIKKGI